jgi:hypothetical protein
MAFGFQRTIANFYWKPEMEALDPITEYIRLRDGMMRRTTQLVQTIFQNHARCFPRCDE